MPAVASANTRYPHHHVDNAAHGEPVERPAAKLPPASKPGPRLTAEQRTIVCALVMQYRDVRAVQAVLLSDYPDYPDISDRTLRQMRHDVDTGNAAWADELRAQQVQVLQQGLARKEHRVKELERMYGQVLAREATAQDTHQHAALRRKRCTILLQIARETKEHTTSLQLAGSEAQGHGGEASTANDEPRLAEVLHLLWAQLWFTDATQPLDLSPYPPDAHPGIAELYDLLTHAVHRARPPANDHPTT